MAKNVGHMVGACLRQPPQPLHCSRLPMKERSLNAKASRGRNDNSIGREKFSRNRESIRRLSVPKIFPGFIRSRGSKMRLISCIAPSNPSPNCSRMYWVRAIPTPCSAESEPLNCFTNAEVWSAIRRNFSKSSARCRSNIGRTSSSPLAVCP